MSLRPFALCAALLAAAVPAHAEVFFAVNDGTDTLCTVDTTTGIITPIGALGVPYAFGDLAFDSSAGVMYMTDGWGASSANSSSLYKVDLTTGVATFVGQMGVTSIFSLVYDPTSNKLYGAISTHTPTGFYGINRTTGAATIIGDPAIYLDGMTYVGSTNDIVGIYAGPGSVHSIDPLTGLSTMIGGSGFVNNCGVAWGPATNQVYSLDHSGNLYAFDVGAGYARTTLFSGLGSMDGLALAGGGCPAPTNYCTSSTTTNGCVPAISATGALSVAAANGCVIDVASVEGQKSGLIFYGASGQVAFPWAPGSTSFFCVKSPTQRTFLQSTGGTNGQCDGALTIDLRNFMATYVGALGSNVSAGDTFQVQSWFRDPPAPKTTNLSNALQIVACP